MKRCFLIIALVLLPTALLAQSNALPAAPHLLVKGHAAQRYVPDRFTIHLSVHAVDKAPAIARTKVATYVKQILAALDRHGALPDRTEASSFSMEPQTEQRDNTEVFIGTEVSRTVDATFDSADKLSALLSDLNTDGDVRITGTEVTRSDKAALENELRKRAITDSQQSARQIAAAYGVHIKGVYSVSEVAPIYSYGINQDLGSVTVTAEALPDVSLRVGTIELEQDIYAVYLTAP